MPGILKAADLTRVDLIEGLQVPGEELASRRIWAEAPDGWTLDYWRGLVGKLNWCGSGRKPTSVSGSECIARACAGRIFAPSGELRWRFIESLGKHCCRTVFLGNTDWTPNRLSERSEILQTLAPHTDRYFLWGQQTNVSDSDWVELSIPHRFRYPVDGSSKRVRAVVELWCDDAGDLHFARICDLESYEEGQ
jgi:hypothetical protein